MSPCPSVPFSQCPDVLVSNLLGGMKNTQAGDGETLKRGEEGETHNFVTDTHTHTGVHIEMVPT